MRDLIKILIWLFFVFLAVIIQTNRLLNLNGVNPNLILLFILLAVVSEKEFRKALILIFAIVLLSAVVLPYWSKQILILGGLGLLALLFKKFLTGGAFWDFLILIVLGTLGFYLLKAPSYLITDFISVVGELIYNIILGIFLVFLITNLTGLRKRL